MTILLGLLFGPCLFHLWEGPTKLLRLQGWKLVSDVKKTQLRSGGETSALLGRPTPMHSRKKLQKKETSAPIPKKYLEYEVSQGAYSGSNFLCGDKTGTWFPEDSRHPAERKGETSQIDPKERPMHLLQRARALEKMSAPRETWKKGL